MLELIMLSTRTKKVVNKRTLFSLDRNFDSTSQNERLIKKILSHHAEKLLPLVEISKN